MKTIKTNLTHRSSPHSLPCGIGFTVLFLLAALTGRAAFFGTEFTYQGRLDGSAGPASGRYDFTFGLYLAASGGTTIVTVTNSNVEVSNGLFTTAVDFGSGIYNGNAYWIQLGVRSNGTAAAFTALSPRQPLTPTPNAHYATLAGTVPGGSINSSKLTVDSVSTAALQNNSVLSNKIANAQVVRNVNGLQDTVILAAGENATLTTNGHTLTLAASSDWKLDGNAGTTPAANFIGTTDNQSLAVKVNGATALRIDPTATAPNIVGGLGGFMPTVVGNNVRGAVVAGGNAPAGPVTGFGGGDFHAVYDSDGAIGGGFGNKVGTDNGNPDDAPFATVAGGVFNGASSYAATVAGGDGNLAGGVRSSVGGGSGNWATGPYSTISGGANNAASGYASFAAGNQAKANHQGSFVWADSQNTDFNSTTSNQFSIRAAGGVRLSDDTPSLSFGTVTRQMLELFGKDYAIGVQPLTTYFRTTGAFAWFDHGSHVDAQRDAGPGGTVLMVLDSTGLGIGTTSPAARLHAVASAGNGVQGNTSDSGASGVYGENNGQGYGVAGRTTGSGTAVLGDNANPNGWAGYFNGRVRVGTLTIAGGADVAEPFQMSGKELPKGAVVVIDEANPGHLRLSESAYDTRVAGIISGANGVNPGISLSQEGVMEGDQNVALSGRVYVQADASNGSIKPGDLLTTSATPGHAMKVADPAKAQGAILGKAMTALAAGKGMVLVLVTLQ